MIKGFMDTQFMTTFRLFPLFNKKSKQYGRDQSEEEDKNDQGKEMSLENRYYVFNYFARSANLNQLLITDAGVSPNEAKLVLKEDFLSIDVKTTKKNFNTMKQNMIGILKNVETKSVQTQSFISLISEFTKPINGKEICQKLQERYNVSITYPVKVGVNKEQDSSRGGHQGGEIRSKPAGSFYAKKLGYQFPFKLEDYLPTLIEQEYKVTGESQDVIIALNAIQQKLQNYDLEIE